MDFARKQLEKYGWSDGKGLGKKENGISEPLKPKMKRSVAGIGHDAAADFTEHWWNTLYNKAANNIEVNEKNGKTRKIKAKEEFEITNSEFKLKRRKKKDCENVEEQYSDFFVKKAVLTNGGVNTEKLDKSDSEEEVEMKDVSKLTDEELFAACGGRTAHKGARHGLKALGKLARIEQQEQMMLNEDRFNGYSHKEKLKKKKTPADDLQQVEKMSLNSDAEVTESKQKKKKKKKYCNIEEKVEDHNEKLEAESEESVPKKVKKKGKKESEINDDEEIDLKLESEILSTNCVQETAPCSEDEIPVKRKKKKKKKQSD